MYTFSNRLKIGSFILMAVGALCLVSGFLSAPSTVEEAKVIVASHGESHGEESGHAVAGEHDASHDEHLLHQLQNRPCVISGHGGYNGVFGSWRNYSICYSSFIGNAHEPFICLDGS